MSAKKPDISQIRKYLDGELDARAMHELEKQALNDPFLQDALEGYELTGKNQQDNLEDLNSRLQQRTQPAKQRTLWPRIVAASSVLLFIAVGGWWVLRQTTNTHLTLPPAGSIVHTPLPVLPHDTAAAIAKRQPTLADADVAQPIGRPTKLIRKPASKVLRDTTTSSPLLAAATSVGKPATQDSANMLNEVVVVGHAAQMKQTVTASVASVPSNPTISEPVGNAPLNNALQGRAAGLNVVTRKDTSQLKTITGQVTDESGAPLPGVMIQVAGKNMNTTTNAEGHFSVKVQKNDQLSVAFIGFETQHLKIRNQGNLQVKLRATTLALNEVVVIPTQQIKEAHPVVGWDSYKKLLQTDSPDGKTGKVRLTFFVNPDNSLTDFIIIKSLSSQADQEAIRLIKEGPAWVHNINGQPEKVKVTINFRNK